MGSDLRDRRGDGAARDGVVEVSHGRLMAMLEDYRGAPVSYDMEIHQIAEDSLTLLAMVSDLEDLCGRKFSDEEILRWATVSDIIESVSK